MARKPVVVFKRPTTKKNRYSYYIKIWDDIRKRYLTPRSAASLVKKLRLDGQEFPSSTRNGAYKIGEAYFRALTTQATIEEPLFVEYLEKFWDWETSPYIEGKRTRGHRIGMEYVKANASYVRNYIAPAFPELKLSEVRPYMLENFIMDIVKEGKVSNRTANAIIDAFKIPLKEAFRQGITQSDPAANVLKFSRNSKPKGIPSDEEIAGLLRQATDLRIRCAIMLGAFCGMRLGEVQAVTLGAVKEYEPGKYSLEIENSWNKLEGLKGTKNEKARVVPLPAMVYKTMLELGASNPHGSEGFLIYGINPDAPLDRAAIERAFDKALIEYSLGGQYDTASREEKESARKEWKERKITFHSLRHYANAKLRGTVPDATLRKLTGHLTPAMTDHYDHTTIDDLRLLAKAQDEKLLGTIEANKEE